MLKISTSWRHLLPALALLGSLSLTACFDKEHDPKPGHRGGKCGTPPPAPTPPPPPTTGGNG